VSRPADVSFCMIVRNGAATLAACLGSIAALCDELIVVDTGSYDNSPDIARSFGAKVVHTRWRDDFAAARNVYLEHARCPWVLCLDADEVLGDVDQDDFVRALAGHPRTAFLFRIRHYFAGGDVPAPTLPSKLHREAPSGPGYMVSRIVRLFPRVPGMRYCFPVHESVLPAITRAGIRVAECAIPIRHMGYVHAGPDSHAKTALYRALGERKVEEFPDYFPGYLELGKVCLHERKLDDAAQMFVRAIRLAPRCVDAHYFLALTLLRQERYRECGRLLHVARGRFPWNPDIRQMVSLFRQARALSANVSSMAL
jgi:glycosyltransferase involved in cell wall biosynthesis